MADIFLSYAREDRDRAELLAKVLEAHGWSVWWDRRIQAGRSFAEVIEGQLESARCVVVLWTRDSIASTWVQNEATEGERRTVLLPIRLDDVRVPLAFRHLQTADLLGWTGETSAELTECIAALEAMIGPPASAAPPPAERPAPVDTTRPTPKRSRKPFAIGAVVVALVALIAILMNFRPFGVRKTGGDAPAVATSAITAVATSTQSLPTANKVLVDFDTTAGRFTIECFPDKAPKHVDYFTNLVSRGFYNGLDFHIVSPRMIQSGDPTTYSGVRRSPVSATSVPIPPEENHDMPYQRGMVALARGAGRDVRRVTSQFFIWFANKPAANYTYFGRVVEGLDVVERIAAAPTDGKLHPLRPVKIRRAVVRSRS